MNFPIGIIHFFACLIVCYGVRCQTAIGRERIEQRYPSFEPKVIADAQIQSIEIEILQKPSSGVIRHNGQKLIYMFDREGRLEQWTKIYPLKLGGLDSLSIIYQYNGDALSQKHEISGNYQKKTEWVPQGSGHVIQRMSVKHGNMPWQLLATDKLETTKTSKGEVTQVSGIQSAPYETIICGRDASGFINYRSVWNRDRIVSEESWIAADGIEQYMFRGNENTWKIKTQSDGLNGTWCFNGACRNWAQVWLNASFPKGWIFLDPTSQDMEVWQFHYRYRTSP